MRKTFGPNHLQTCPAKNKIYAKCAKRGNFAKVCRSANFNFLHNNNEEQSPEEDDHTQDVEEKGPVAFADFTSKNG